MIKDNREYRFMPLLTPSEEKKFDSDYYIEGYATTFNQPYVLWEYNGIKYKEVIDSHAFDDCDMSDVLFQYNHAGRVYARTKMKKGKKPTMVLEKHEHGLFVGADLCSTSESRKMYEDIDTGLIYHMSFAFVVAEDSYNRETHTRTITKIKKVYDVSAVDIPANPHTDISARSYFEGVIEAEQREASERAREIEVLKLMALL